MKVRDASSEASRGGRNQTRRTWTTSLRHRLCFGYARLISHHPILLCLVILVAVVACGLVVFLLYDLPSFSDPVAGFEPRGTTISQRSVTWQNILDQTGAGQLLSVYPAHHQRPPNRHAKPLPQSALPLPTTASVTANTTTPVTSSSIEGPAEASSSTDAPELGAEDDSSTSSLSELPHDGNPHEETEDEESFFCFNPTREYARIVFEPVHSSNLLTLQGLQAMCQLDEDNVRKHVQFMRNCYTSSQGECCRSWSIGNYVALLNNRTSCEEITAGDVASTIHLLQKCSHFYRSRSLRSDCWEKRNKRPCSPTIHEDCMRYDAVYSIMHYLVDIGFMSVEKPNNARVRNAMLILPVHAGNDMREIYKNNFEDKDVGNAHVRVTGLFFDLKYDLFGEHLTAETLYPCLGVLIIILLMWIYIGSLFITLMTVLSMAMSLVVSYFFYRVVFNIPFFPFMNLTAIILLVGIGADDTFVYCDIWKVTRQDHVNTPHVLLVLDTLGHAAISMLAPPQKVII